MKQDEQPVGTIKEHVKKRLEASDREFLFGADRVDVRRVKPLGRVSVHLRSRSLDTDLGVRYS